jgi:Protein of unknown function (DUF664)
MTTDPLLEGARQILEESLDELLKAIRGLEADALNARIGGPDTNTLAILAAHALSSTRSWLSLAMGAPLPPRDRPAEFRTVAGEGFMEWAEGLARECRGLLAIDGFDAQRSGVPTWTSGEAKPRTASWSLFHAVSHLGEHVGHAQLTRQLLDEGRVQPQAS